MARQTNKNHIITDEKRKIFNNTNVEILNDFMIYLQSTGKKEGTILNYHNDIEMFFVWNLEANKNKDFVNLTKREVMFFQNYCLNVLKLGSARYRRLRSSISSMSNYIENMMDDVYPTFRNIINKIEAPPKSAVREKTVFEDDELKNLLDELVEQEEYQKACILALAMGSGNRKSELLRFKVSFFVDENIRFGSLWKTPEISVKGRGDTKKQRWVLISTFKPYLDLWLKERERLGINCDELFVIYKNDGTYTPMTVSSLNYYADLFTKMIGKHFYFHSMRHYMCTHLAKNNIPDDVIQEIIGWASLDMVSIYKDIDSDDKIGKYFDENGIKEITQKSLSDL